MVDLGIDVNREYWKMFDKMNAAFIAAKNDGRIDEARKLASDIATILTRMAANDPMERKRFTASAAKWRRIGNGEAPVIPKKIIKTSPTGDSDTEDDFSSQIESLITESSVTWDDIGGLKDVKKLMKNTVVIAAIQKPDSVRSWSGILLFGPPGTGKTMLAAAAAGSLHATFYNASADKLLSKYFGEAPKLISALYDSATERAPSIVFMDEIDSLAQSRDNENSDASRKVLTSLLQEMDGLKNKKSKKLLLTIGATNRPWDLDEASLSRFPRRIMIDLPDVEACKSIIQIQLKGLDISKLNLDELSEKCHKNLFAGRDIEGLCQTATWNMIYAVNPKLETLADLPYEEIHKKMLETRSLEMSDFEEAFKTIHSPLTKETLEKYYEWQKKYGETAR